MQNHCNDKSASWREKGQKEHIFLQIGSNGPSHCLIHTFGILMYCFVMQASRRRAYFLPKECSSLFWAYLDQKLQQLLIIICLSLWKSHLLGPQSATSHSGSSTVFGCMWSLLSESPSKLNSVTGTRGLRCAVGAPGWRVKHGPQREENLLVTKAEWRMLSFSSAVASFHNCGTRRHPSPSKQSDLFQHNECDDPAADWKNYGWKGYCAG